MAIARTAINISVLAIGLLGGFGQSGSAAGTSSEACLEGDCGAKLVFDPLSSSNRTSPPRISNIGRPQNHTSEFLAHCAGFMDAIAEVADQRPSDWLSGEEYMKAAVAQRERPNMPILQSQRMASYATLLLDVQELRDTHSTGIIHGYMMCRGNYELQNFEISVK